MDLIGAKRTRREGRRAVIETSMQRKLAPAHEQWSQASIRDEEAGRRYRASCFRLLAENLAHHGLQQQAANSRNVRVKTRSTDTLRRQQPQLQAKLRPQRQVIMQRREKRYAQINGCPLAAAF